MFAEDDFRRKTNVKNSVTEEKMEESRYKKQKLIGRGSYGEAHLVISTLSHKCYVMKTINLGKTQEKPVCSMIHAGKSIFDK